MGSRAFPPPFQGSPVVAGRPRVPLRFTLGYGSRRRFAGSRDLRRWRSSTWCTVRSTGYFRKSVPTRPSCFADAITGNFRPA